MRLVFLLTDCVCVCEGVDVLEVGPEIRGTSVSLSLSLSRAPGTP